MARIRSIKPETFTSHSVAAVSLEARWTFVGLWTYCDDHGRGQADTRLIKSAIYPLQDDVAPVDVELFLKELEREDMICRYDIEGRSYLHVRNWERHQKISKPTPSKLPPCPAHEIPGIPGETSLGTGNREQGSGNREQGTGTADAAAFDDFWAAYPKKVGKGDSRTAWGKAIKREKPAVIIAAARRYRDDPNLPEPKYIPNPSTWLNQGRWDDDPCPPRWAPTRPTASDKVREAAARAQAMRARASMPALPALEASS